MPKFSKAELVSFMVTGAACEGLASALTGAACEGLTPALGDFVVTGAGCEGLAPVPGAPDAEQPAARAAAARPTKVAASCSPEDDRT